MKTVCALLLTLAAVGWANPITIAPLLAADSLTAVEREYIVVFKEDTTYEKIGGHKKFVRQMLNESSEIKDEYDIGGGFRGYSALVMDEEIEKIRQMPEVDYVERNQELKANADCNLQTGATWGIVRTTLRGWSGPGTSSDYNYHLDGSGVDVYIIDTGIYIEHEEFSGGRAVWGYDAVSNPSPRKDGNGHGTHVAGTVVGNKYGLAKKATAIAVRVLNDNGSGTTAGVIAGVNWVAGQHNSGKKSVANMSLGGGVSTSLDNAVNAAVNKGVHFAVAAGNENSNACYSSPARATNPVTVGATDSSDQRSYFSNYGTCVDIFAPGSSITSAWITGRSSYNTISGTSMASPHVAGVMAKLLQEDNYTPSSMKTKLDDLATKGIISDVGSGSPNRLLFLDCA